MLHALHCHCSLEQDFNRTEGDGTDSPMIASPYHDQRRKDRLGGAPPPYYGINPSPAGRIHSQSFNTSSRSSSDPRSPDGRGRPQLDPGPYPGAEGDWQVRGPSGRYDGMDRSYTPPIPDYNNTADYSLQHGLNQLSLNQPANPNYEYHDSVDYPTSPYNEYGGTSYPPTRPDYGRHSDYDMSDRYPGGVRQQAVLMPPHQPVMSQEYRNQPYDDDQPTYHSDYHNERLLTSAQVPPQHGMYERGDGRYDYTVMY